MSNFIKNEGNNILRALNSSIDKEVVIHYNCHSCDDEQVSCNEAIEEDLCKQFRDNFIPLHIPCTNCGINTKVLELEYIQGIEII